MHNLSSSIQTFGNRVDYTGIIAVTTPAGFGNESAAIPLTTTTKGNWQRFTYAADHREVHGSEFSWHKLLDSGAVENFPDPQYVWRAMSE
jgi:hypothetical protein